MTEQNQPQPQELINPELPNNLKLALEMQEYSPQTIRGYVYHAKNLLPFMNQYGITQEGIDKFIMKYNNRVTRAFLKKLFKHYHIKDLDIAAIRGRKGRKIPRWLYPWEISELALSFEDPEMSAFVITAFQTGLRLSELISLTAQHVDWINSQVRGIGKGKVQFEQCITEKNRDLLSVVCESKMEGIKIFNVDNHTIQRRLNVQGKRLWNKRVHPHLLRHSCGHFLGSNGVDKHTIGLYLNHQTSMRDVTELYVHTDRASVLKKVRGLFEQWEDPESLVGKKPE
jgi:integrase